MIRVDPPEHESAYFSYLGRFDSEDFVEGEGFVPHADLAVARSVDDGASALATLVLVQRPGKKTVKLNEIRTFQLKKR